MQKESGSLVSKGENHNVEPSPLLTRGLVQYLKPAALALPAKDAAEDAADNSVADLSADG